MTRGTSDCRRTTPPFTELLDRLGAPDLSLGSRFHNLGNTVIIGGRRTELLDQIASDQPGIHTIQIDTTDPDSIATATKVAEHLGLNVHIPMVGIMVPEDLHTPD